MLKLAKADIYRFFKSGIFSKILILLSCLLPIVMFLISLTFKHNDAGLDDFLIESQMPLLMIVMLAIPTIFAVFVGTSYNSRLAYYEIMDGNKPLKIVVTKIISLGLLVSTIVYVPFAILCGIVGGVNGFGNMENPVLFFLLTYVIFAHIIIATLLFSMIARNLILASFIPYIRMGFLDLLVTMIGEVYFLADGKDVPAFFDVFIYNQMGKFTSGVYSNSFVVYTILSAVIEIAVLASIAVMVYRKKKFK